MNIDRWRVKKIKVSCVIINLDIFWKDVLVLFIYHLHIIHVLFHEWNTLKGQSSGNKFRGTLIRVNVDRFIRIILNQIQDLYWIPSNRFQPRKWSIRMITSNSCSIKRAYVVAHVENSEQFQLARSLADIKRRREGKLAKGE